MSAAGDLVLVEGAGGPVATVTVNRPTALNALDGATLAALFATDDQKEGMRAFIEKRTPKWSGR